METQSPKKVIYEDENFILHYGIRDRILYLHCDVFNWKLSSLRKGYQVFADLLKRKNEYDADRIVTVTPNPKFAKLFGGTTVGYIVIDGIEYEGIEWEW